MGYDNSALVRRFFDEFWTQGRLDVADEIVAPNSVSFDPIGGELRGIEGIKALQRQYRSAYPDLRFDIEDLIASGDKVVARWKATGTHKGALLGVAPTGKTYAIEGISVMRFSNGKVVESRDQWDTFKLLQNLGLVVPSGAAAGGPTLSSRSGGRASP